MTGPDSEFDIGMLSKSRLQVPERVLKIKAMFSASHASAHVEMVLISLSKDRVCAVETGGNAFVSKIELFKTDHDEGFQQAGQLATEGGEFPGWVDGLQSDATLCDRNMGVALQVLLYLKPQIALSDVYENSVEGQACNLNDKTSRLFHSLDAFGSTIVRNKPQCRPLWIRALPVDRKFNHKHLIAVQVSSKRPLIVYVMNFWLRLWWVTLCGRWYSA